MCVAVAAKFAPSLPGNDLLYEIEELKEEQEYLRYLTKYMLENDLIKPEELGLSDNETSADKAESESSHK